MSIIGYLRVSTNIQDIMGQRFAIEKYCEQNDLAIDQWIEAKISSRRNPKERRISELLDSLRKGDRVIVSELSRLGRSVPEVSNIIQEFLKRKIYFHSLKENLHFNGSLDVFQKAVIYTLTMLAELQRDLLSQRTREGIQAAKLKGKIPGNPRIGEINKRSKEHADEFARSLEKTLSAYCSAGMSQREILAELNERGIRTRRGCSWSLPSLQRTLKRLNLRTRGESGRKRTRAA